MSSIVLALFIVNLEVTIVSTSLVDITNDLQGFDKTSWIVTGYLITFTGMRNPRPAETGLGAKAPSSIHDYLGKAQ